MQKVVFIFFIFLILGGFRVAPVNRMYMNTSFRPEKAETVRKVLINFKDSIPDDTLTIYFSPANSPVAYSRNFHTAVCIDSLCRIVDITLFWEVTGKYLGFTLPKGEELTKKEHVPFLESEYIRLNEILADSTSQLGFYTPEEIHPVKKAVAQTDGITGATSPDLAPWIVPEAAYTCYSLWHLTYGATRDSITGFTKKHLISNQLLSNLLQDNNPYNQIKGLQWLQESKPGCNQFTEKALAILHGTNYPSAEQALKFLKNCMTDQEKLQKEVIQLFDAEDFRTKNIAISYLRESQELAPAFAKELMTRIKSDNYYLVNTILTLLDKRYQPDQDDQLKLCELLKSNNSNVANRVYYFLTSLPVQSPDLVKRLKQYR